MIRLKFYKIENHFYNQPGYKVGLEDWPIEQYKTVHPIEIQKLSDDIIRMNKMFGIILIDLIDGDILAQHGRKVSALPK